MSGSEQPTRRSNATKAASAAPKKTAPAAARKGVATAPKKTTRRKKGSSEPEAVGGLSAGGWKILLAVQLVLALGALYSCASGDKHLKHPHAAATPKPAR